MIGKKKILSVLLAVSTAFTMSVSLAPPQEVRAEEEKTDGTWVLTGEEYSEPDDFTGIDNWAYTWYYDSPVETEDGYIKLFRHGGNTLYPKDQVTTNTAYSECQIPNTSYRSDETIMLNMRGTVTDVYRAKNYVVDIPESVMCRTFICEHMDKEVLDGNCPTICTLTDSNRDITLWQQKEGTSTMTVSGSMPKGIDGQQIDVVFFCGGHIYHNGFYTAEWYRWIYTFKAGASSVTTIDQKNTLNPEDYEIIGTTFNASTVVNTQDIKDSPEDYTVSYTADYDFRCVVVTTYHWNYGHGEEPGTIAIEDTTTGEFLGEWDAVARDGSGAHNVYWDIFPDIDFKEGHKYKFVDSSPRTWSMNAESNYIGFIEIRGILWYDMY